MKSKVMDKMKKGITIKSHENQQTSMNMFSDEITNMFT